MNSATTARNRLATSTFYKYEKAAWSMAPKRLIRGNFLVEPTGIEPVTSTLPVLRSPI